MYILWCDVKIAVIDSVQLKVVVKVVRITTTGVSVPSIKVSWWSPLTQPDLKCEHWKTLYYMWGGVIAIIL